ncbi:MAG: inositol monophosphatase family protein [Polyangiaceae bacterium]
MTGFERWFRNSEPSVIELPARLRKCPWAARLRVAVDAVMSGGAALAALRGAPIQGEELDSQLKTAVDLAAEGWVLGLLRGSFPDDRFLAEELYAERPEWNVDERPFWTIDALDGTRSYVEGFPGFCVQVAYVVAGRPVFGAIAEPMSRSVFVAAEGCGAYELKPEALARLLEPRALRTLPAAPRFVDSTPPGGAVGRLVAETNGVFVECGSVGLKACRVVADAADVYAKAFRFRIWDVAPAEVLLRETACSLRLWNGQPIDYSGATIEFRDLLAAPTSLIDSLLVRLA